MKKILYIFREDLGMTILELMITFTILLIVMGAAFGFLVFSQRQYMWIDADQKIQQDLRELIQRMTIDIRDGKEIIPGSDTTYLILSMPIVDAVGNVSVFTDTIIYSVDPADTSRLRMNVRQMEGSTYKGWGDRISTQIVAGPPVETRTLWIIAKNLTNTDTHDPIPLFSYDDTVPILLNSGCNAVVISFKIRRQSTPGKFQSGILRTSVRLRNRI